VVEDTNKQKKETHTNGNTESVTHSLNQENREENKMSSPFKDYPRCIECKEVPQTTLNFDGRCVGCIAYMIEDCV